MVQALIISDFAAPAIIKPWSLGIVVVVGPKISPYGLWTLWCCCQKPTVKCVMISENGQNVDIEYDIFTFASSMAANATTFRVQIVKWSPPTVGDDDFSLYDWPLSSGGHDEPAIETFDVSISRNDSCLASLVRRSVCQHSSVSSLWFSLSIFTQSVWHLEQPPCLLEENRSEYYGNWNIWIIKFI